MHKKSQTNETTHPKGLTPELALEAKNLRFKAGKAAARLVVAERTRAEDERYMSDFAFDPVRLSHRGEITYKKLRASRSARKAAEHFKKHEAGYQMQALTEATADGVKIHGWEHEQEGAEALPLVGTLKYDLHHGNGTRSVEIDLTGSLEDAQDAAFETVLAAEMNPRNISLVHGAHITLANGTEQSWHEFTAPALERYTRDQPES